MNISRALTVAVVLALTPTSAVVAQTDPRSSDVARTQERVDQLKEVIRGAEQDRRSSLSITRQLKDLVRRYDWPWRVAVLHDDFRDGDYTYNPRWIVRSGDFRVVRGAGLRSYFEGTNPGTYRTSDSRSENPALEILTGILIGKRESGVNESEINSAPRAEIFTPVGISNAFALRLQLKLRNYENPTKRFEFGPYQGDARHSGYRLAYESGRTPSLSLLRFGAGRSAVIETVDQGVALDDGLPHSIEWRRNSNGEMVVLIDDKEVIRTMDRAYGDRFDGFALINEGGEFDISEVSIFGTSDSEPPGTRS